MTFLFRVSKSYPSKILSIGCTEEKLEGLIDGNGHVAGRLGVGTIVVDGQATATRATAENGTSGGVNKKGVFLLPPNVAITSLTGGDTLSVTYTFGDATYTGTVMLRTGGVWGLDMVPISPEMGSTTESWAKTRMSVACRAGRKGVATVLKQGMNCIDTEEGTITGIAGKLPTRSFMDALVAVADPDANMANEQVEGAVKEGMVYVDRDEESPKLGRFSASLVHAGALMRLKAEDISTETEGIALKELWAMVTIASETYYVPFTTVTVGSTAMLQAIVPDKAAVSAFVVISGKTAVTDATKFSTNTMTLSKPQTLARNLRYPLTLTIINRTKAVVEFTAPAGLPGWGTQEEEMIDFSKHLKLVDEVGGRHSYEVYSASGLIKVAEWINSTTDAPAPQSTNTTSVNKSWRMTTSITLMRNIVLPKVAENESNWTPIGDNSNNSYSGTFDGGGYTITGLSIVSDAQSHSALISKNLGIVKDLTMKDVKITNDKTGSMAAAVAGLNSGRVLNCHLTGIGNISCPQVGGIVGQNGNGYVIACSNNSTVSIGFPGGGNSYRGDLVGYNTAGVSYLVGSWSSIGTKLPAGGQGYQGTHCYSSSDCFTINSAVSDMNAAITDYNNAQSDIKHKCLSVWKMGANTSTDMPTITPPPAMEYDKASNTYSVRTAEKLQELNVWLASTDDTRPAPLGENGRGYEGTYADKMNINITLNANITLTGTNNWKSVVKYCGTIDGKGYKISGLHIDDNTPNEGLNRPGCGFVSTLEAGSSTKAGGVIKNLTLENIFVKNPLTVVGGFAAGCSGSITNCKLSGNCTILGRSSVGGIAGVLNGSTGREVDGKITDCHVGAGSKISGQGKTGGIVGYMRVGVDAGVTNIAIISGCSNSGAVSYALPLDGQRGAIGGIAGWNERGEINSSFNVGEVSHSGAFKDQNLVAAGGIVGDNGGAVVACYNLGSVTGVKDVGGIAGCSTGALSFACTDGKTRFRGIFGSWSIGKVWRTEGESIFIGGMVGKLDNSSVSGCYPSSSTQSGVVPGGGPVNAGSFVDVNRAIESISTGFRYPEWTWTAAQNESGQPVLKKKTT